MRSFDNDFRGDVGSSSDEDEEVDGEGNEGEGDGPGKGRAMAVSEEEAQAEWDDEDDEGEEGEEGDGPVDRTRSRNKASVSSRRPNERARPHSLLAKRLPEENEGEEHTALREAQAEEGGGEFGIG